jgi:SAM-dependent methyltransferase
MPGSISELPAKATRLARRALGYEFAGRFGGASKFDIHPGYTHRSRIAYFDDTENTDNWQREVYETARDLMREKGLRTVYDVGCGSGFKLVHMLGEFDTTGIDLSQTIQQVRQVYPDRKWISGSFDELELPPADVVICSDVVEHVADPDALMSFLARTTREWAVLSTPDRDLVYGWRNPHRFGPPENPAHVREWNMAEFGRYAGRYFSIERHFVSNREQATQCVVARLRKSPSSVPRETG